MPSNSKLEYAIVGGGIAGLSLAIALNHRGVHVTIYEAAHHFGEIGAGVGFGENAIESLKLCHPGMLAAFEKVNTGNVWPSKHDVWFDVYDSFPEVTPSQKFALTSDIGMAGVHRAAFLDEMIKLLPEGLAHFGKRLDTLTRTGDDGRWTLNFVDGTTATADAVIGCDGIKSRVRQLMYGENDPRSYPTYTHRYAYRALAPMEDAVAAIGEAKALNSCMHMGEGGHILHFPIDHGKIFNVVAFRQDEGEWADHNKLTKPAHREDALNDFKGFGSDIDKILRLTKPDLDIWAIFHLGDNPLPAYNKSTLLLVGDAAHATSPHHGGGAGMCIEDCAVLAKILSEDSVQSAKDAEVAFATFDSERRERGNWLVQSSFHLGNCYNLMDPETGKDFTKLEKEINARNRHLWDVDVSALCEQASQALKTALARARGSPES